MSIRLSSLSRFVRLGFIAGLIVFVSLTFYFIRVLTASSLNKPSQVKIQNAVGTFSALATNTIRNLHNLDQFKSNNYTSQTSDSAANIILQNAFVRAITNLNGTITTDSTARIWAEYEELRKKSSQ